VYLLDPATNRYVHDGHMKGWVPQSVVQSYLGLSPQGLVGLVGSRKKPIILEDAPSPSSLRTFSETGEEPLPARILGVPLFHIAA